jgi:limonene-1,2-epoxide hydrolase
MTPVELVEIYVEAFNNVDIETLTGLYADDAVNHQVVTDPVIGREAIGKMFQYELTKTPMVCIVENIFEKDEWVVLEWKEPLGFRGCEIFRIVNGKIKLQRGYYDTSCFLKEHGLTDSAG